MVTDDDDCEEYDSGPFCRHWSDPSDCDITCMTCGHKCREHGVGDDTECQVSDCDCKQWTDDSEEV